MNRQNLKAFGKLKLIKWDEMNVTRQVEIVYTNAVRLAKQKYYEIAFDAFVTALYLALVSPKEATKIADEIITFDWVQNTLEEVDAVTLYAFLSETERKKQRLIESLAVAHNKNAEIDKALRYWSRQVSQYADNTVYKARIQAFMEAGVKKVVWITQDDERVCDSCEPLDGMVFDIEKAPGPQHWGCRCELWPVID